MTDAPADDRRAVSLDDDGYLTVEQLAELRRVTPAAVRAQLRAGNLAGEQVLQGQRTVWRIPMSAARGYLERSGGADRPVDVRPSEPERPSTGQVEVLEAEVRRLRRQLSALADAHHRLLDAVTAELFEDR
jgi:hypothetical protein